MSTPDAAGLAADMAARKAMEHGMRQVSVFVRGPGAGREAAIRSLQAAGLEVTAIVDRTPIPHNGCRPPKKGRVGGSLRSRSWAMGVGRWGRSSSFALTHPATVGRQPPPSPN